MPPVAWSGGPNGVYAMRRQPLGNSRYTALPSEPAPPSVTHSAQLPLVQPATNSRDGHADGLDGPTAVYAGCQWRPPSSLARFAPSSSTARSSRGPWYDTDTTGSGVRSTTRHVLPPSLVSWIVPW